jgi:hypothetical protein
MAGIDTPTQGSDILERNQNDANEIMKRLLD